MSNESNLQNGTDSVSKNKQTKHDVQYRFDATAGLCNVAMAKPVAVMLDQQMPTVQLTRDLIGKIPYSYGVSSGIGASTFSKRPTAASVIKKCQIAFSEIIHSIGDPTTTHMKQAEDRATAEACMSGFSTEVRAVLDRQLPITEFGMRWEPNFQVFYGSGKIFANNGTTNTVPTHDLAHLLVGACGNLPWCPEGGQEEVRLAEYYAVFIENIFDKVYAYIVNGTFNRDTALYEAITYARWFVDVHYAPFPIPAEEAYRRFCKNMDVAAIVRLSPLFFALKHVERTFAGYRDQIWELHFNTEDAPPAEKVAVICPDGRLN